MIEVEKKFQPTDEQFAQMLEGAEFLGDKTLHDLYFDFHDYRLIRADNRLRRRNNGWELKLGGGSGVAQEIETEAEIQAYFGIAVSIDEFAKENLIEAVNFTNQRKKYSKNGFAIDVDSMDFGYKLVEIELLVESPGDVAQAEQKILDFVRQFGIEHKEMPAKREEYFRIKKPEVYELLYKQ